RWPGRDRTAAPAGPACAGLSAGVLSPRTVSGSPQKEAVMAREFDVSLETFDAEARRTADLMRALPHDKYDFRPDPKGRSLGELAWHLSEIDAYMAHGDSRGGFDGLPQGIERPRTVAELAPGFETVHRAASDQLRAMGDVDWEKTIPFFDGR